MIESTPTTPATIRPNLTLENYFNDAMAKWPAAVQLFCKWVDDYKAKHDWPRIFNAGISVSGLGIGNGTTTTVGSITTTAPKFHDLPLAFQTGMFIQFVADVVQPKTGMLTWVFAPDDNKLEKAFDFVFMSLTESERTISLSGISANIPTMENPIDKMREMSGVPPHYFGGTAQTSPAQIIRDNHGRILAVTEQQPTPVRHVEFDITIKPNDDAEKTT